MSFDVVFDNWQFILEGVKVTVEIAVLTAVGGSILGLIGAIGRLAGGTLINVAVKLYVDFFRSVPLAIWLIWVYFALPVFLDKSIPRFLAAVVALSLYEAAYFVEIFRAGILAVTRGQRYAGLALGMRSTQLYRRIIVPQAFTMMLPVIASQLVFLLKDTSVVFVIQVADLTFASQTLGAQFLEPMAALTAALVLYVVLAYPITIAGNVAHSHYRA
jgi:polar amino acid transport system permease protein